MAAVDDSQLVQVGFAVIMLGAGLVLLFPDVVASVVVGVLLVAVGGLTALSGAVRRRR